MKRRWLLFDRRRTHPDGKRVGTWSSARRRLAYMALVTAILPGGVGVVLDGSSTHAYGAVVYVWITLLAMFFPAAITAQVISGQILVGMLLVGQRGPDLLLLAAAVASVVATAELLAVVARLDTPLQRDPGDALPRAGLAAVLGGGVFGAVTLVSGFVGPTGLLAVAMASGACIVLALKLASNAA